MTIEKPKKLDRAEAHMKGRYRILDIERLWSHMSRITNTFLDLLSINGSDIREWIPGKESDLTEVTQLLSPLNDFRIL